MRKQVSVTLPKKKQELPLKDKLIQYLVKNPDKTPEQLYKHFKTYNPRHIRLIIASLIADETIKKITCKCEQSHYFRVN